MGEARTKALLAKSSSRSLAALSSVERDRALELMADALIRNADQIIEENRKDMARAAENGKPQAFLDRLMLNEPRIGDMAKGLLSIRQLSDPIGETVSAWIRPNGLEIAQIRVPLGVVGIIYESRPNVTADAIGLCIKTANAVVLRGGSDAINSNRIIADILAQASLEAGVPEGAIQLIHDTDRSSAVELMTLSGIIDVLIPRGEADS